MNLELLIVAVLVAGSLGYVARNAWYGIRAANADKSAGCGGCNACGGCPTDKPSL